MPSISTKYSFIQRYFWAFVKTVVLFSLLFATLHAVAQIGYSVVNDPLIKTLQLKVDGNENVLPIIKKGSGERLEISFDFLSHEYQRFTYKLEHCDYLGNITSDLFTSDYLYSVSDETVIEDYEYSSNTTVLYTH